MVEIRTGNDVIGWVTWTVEVPEATRWEILKRDLAMVRAAPGGGVEIVADVTGLVELLEATTTTAGGVQAPALQARHDDGSAASVRGLPHAHLRDLAGQIAWWLHTGMDLASRSDAGAGTGNRQPETED